MSSPEVARRVTPISLFQPFWPSSSRKSFILCITIFSDQLTKVDDKTEVDMKSGPEQKPMKARSTSYAAYASVVMCRNNRDFGRFGVPLRTHSLPSRMLVYCLYKRKRPTFRGPCMITGAEGGIRTPTPCGATPSRWCVCQFRHFRMR